MHTWRAVRRPGSSVVAIVHGFKTLRREWSTIRRAPWSVAITAVVAGALASAVVSYYFERQLARREDQIVAVHAELTRVEERLKGASAKVRGTARDALDVVENLRDIIQDARERQWGLPAFDTRSPFTPTEFARYERRYRVRAQVLREFFLSKLPASERNDAVQRAYDGPLTLEGLRLIADDLERLARKVPD